MIQDLRDPSVKQTQSSVKVQQRWQIRVCQNTNPSNVIIMFEGTREQVRAKVRELWTTGTEVCDNPKMMKFNSPSVIDQIQVTEL